MTEPVELNDPAPTFRYRLKAFIVWWLIPRAADRDEAFRERILRSAISIVTILTTLSFAASLFVFQDKWRLLSFPTLHILGFLFCISAAISVSRGRLVVTGWLIVFLALTGASGVVLLSRQNGSVAGIFLGVPSYTMVPVVATLVLPRSRLIPVSLMSIVAYSLAHFAIPVGSFVVEGLQAEFMLVPVVLLLLFEGILLRQLRVEFDARLEEMRKSVVETEKAKQQADIARQQAEADRRRAEDADRAKSQFLANISHELRTPLNAIIGFDEAMLAGMAGDFTPQQHKLLGRIQHSSRRLLDLINDILDLSRIESGSLEVYWAPMEPHKVIRDSVDSLRSLADAKGIYLDLSIAETVPSVIVTDARKIEQIVVNLLSNAIKFTEIGGVRVAVHGGVEDAWSLEVADTGIGIPVEAQPFVFDPFRQVDGTLRRKYQGTGLGLSITKRLVEELGGTIRISSAPGVGSTFTAVFPLSGGSRSPSNTSH
jgi:signal transduction histidine kinase